MKSLHVKHTENSLKTGNGRKHFWIRPQKHKQQKQRQTNETIRKQGKETTNRAQKDMCQLFI